MVTILIQEVSIHVYEKRGTERVGRGRRKEAIAEILKVVAVMGVISWDHTRFSPTHTYRIIERAIHAWGTR